jgi:kinetochore-associated protein 1
LKLAWEFIIQDALISASKTKNYDNDLQISKSFIALQKCPISTFLNLTGFAEKCMLLERPHMAAIFIAFAKENDREKITKMLSACDKRELKKNIEELEEFGIAPVISKAVINILQL